MSKSVKLNSGLWARVEEQAAKAGYSSPEEFVEHVLERELASEETDEADGHIGRRLKGLGYLE